LYRSLKTGLPNQGLKNPSVAKLFAKHMKLKEQVELLKQSEYARN
jgi:protein CMS1